MTRVILMYIRIFMIQIVIGRAVSGASMNKQARKQLSLSFPLATRKRGEGGGRRPSERHQHSRSSHHIRLTI